MSGIRAATEADFDPVFDLLDRRSRRVLGISEVDREHLRQSWGPPGWVVQDDGGVVGFAAVDTMHRLELAAPSAAIADALLVEAEAAARGLGYGTLVLATVPEDDETGAFVRSNGFELDRTVLRMWRALDGKLPEPVWPDGVSVRTYADQDAAAVMELLDRAYAGWDEEHVPRRLDDWLSWMTDHDEFDPSLWFLVERAGRLVACALHWRETQGRGWLKDLVVDEAERGRGLGRALIHHGFRSYRARGADRIGLKVDSSNPTGAPALYAGSGFEVDRRYELWLKRL